MHLKRVVRGSIAGFFLALLAGLAVPWTGHLEERLPLAFLSTIYAAPGAILCSFLLARDVERLKREKWPIPNIRKSIRWWGPAYALIYFLAALLLMIPLNFAVAYWMAFVAFPPTLAFGIGIGWGCSTGFEDAPLPPRKLLRRLP